ncbi:hypothetical protein HRbin16_01409 [bacterium HR16]|nr:hypothetical protein HRbin16_01409 [bacterium HR16]
MVVTGVLKGKTIELDKTVDLPEGTRVEVYLKPRDQGGENLIGLFADDPELVDAVVEQAMRSREIVPLRVENG